MDPPLCVQNAMMTKDKKPFTYTPGGIDLSEVRSPRMARRIERNAHLGGVGEAPRPQTQQPQNYNNLPPSTLAAMRPQPQVQVFPSGPPPPPPMKGKIPPPPPPPMNAPPPPPPPTCALPTQKIKTSDNQVLERPDMTKIIPEDPMKLLRKTGGPQQRKSVVDQMFEEAHGGARPAPRTPPSPPQKMSSQYDQQPRFQPPQLDRGIPISPVPQQPQQYQQPSPPFRPQPQQYQPPVQQNQSQPAPQYQPLGQQFQPQSPQTPPETSRYQPPVIERQPSMKAEKNTDPEIKTSTAHLGSLYIPPANQQQQQQRKVASPPSPPERNLDSPGLQTPPLKEAPKPWQSKKPQQEEIPPWAKKNNEPEEKTPSPSVQPPQQRWPQSKPVPQNQGPQPSYNPSQQQSPQPYHNPNQPQTSGKQQQQQQPIGVRIEIRTNYPQYEEPEEEERHPNAVYVTQPMVFQHPGPRVPAELQQKPKPKVDSQGARVIPIQVERGPGTPGAERSLNRQQSWGSNPTQSNSFKVIQKLTQTDNDDDIDFDAPMTEHPPTFPQNFQQPADQLGRMKISDSDHNMMNRFNQVPRGPSVQNNSGPRVRTIPIKIEDDESPKPYVHPSQQTVPEPKKYTGSSIPSRSFKILQAMTAPENNASADEENDATLYDQWGFGPCYPPYPPPPPYWHDYYHNYYYSEPNNSEFSNTETESNSKSPARQTQLSPSNSSCGRQTPSSGRQTPVYRTRTPIPGRQTPTQGRTTPIPRQSFPPRPSPVPFWGYIPPPFPYPPPKKSSVAEDSDSESNIRPAASPYWNHQFYSSEEIEEDYTDANGYPPYPYYDPYYYYYGYPYPPLYPPYPYYGATDSEDYAGYSSTDEMAFYNKNSANNSHSSLTSNTKKQIDPTLNIKEQVCRIEVTEPESDQEPSEAREVPPEEKDCTLKSIKSVSNINVYYDSADSEEGVDSAGETSDETNEDSEDDESVNNEDGYPHQLSVIFEESERTESRLRSVSVMSDATTIANRSDDEEEITYEVFQQPKQIASSVTENKVEENCESNGIEVYASFTLKSRSATPKQTSPCRFDEVDKDINKCSVNMESEIENPSITEEQIIVNESVDEGKESDGSEDWWGILGGEDDLPKPKATIINKNVQDIETPDESNTADAKSLIIPRDVVDEINTDAGDRENKDKDTKDRCSDIESATTDGKLESVLDTDLINITKREAIQSFNKLDLDSIEYKKRSIYDDSDEDETTGKLIEMGSFVEQLQQIQKQAGLWKANLKFMDLKKSTNQNTTTINDKKADLEVTQSLLNRTETRQYKEAIEIENSWGNIERDDNKMTVPYCRKEESFESGYSASYTEYSCSSSKSDIASPHVKEIVENDQACTDSHSKNVPKLTKQAEIDKADGEESSDGTSSSSEDEDNDNGKNDENNNENEVKVMSIKERIQSLRECIKEKQAKYEEHEIKTSIKERINALEINNRSKTTSTKSSLKSFEEYSEEEDFDSGVTSDMSRHISDNEEFPELRKLTKYQRAATHSRLFKLLQDGCDSDDEEENTTNNTAENNRMNKRDHLTLPLSKSPDEFSACSSGLSSPNCQVNEKLVEELVQSLLRRKKGQVFRNIPKEKLYAAATRIIQEDFGDELDAQEDCNSFLSPLRCSTGYSTAAQTPQEFNSSLDEYNQYYDSWREAEKLDNESCYDVLPSKIFKELSKTGSIAGLLAKCPRVLSSKNIHKKLMKLLENSESNSQNPEKPLDTNEVTTAS